jgi:hypothetical protein
MRTRKPLIAAALCLAAFGASTDVAAAKVKGNQITHFRVFDTGPGIAWEMRICTTRKMKLRFEAESYYSGMRNARYDYGRGSQKAGCRLWRLETVSGPEFPEGRWRSRMNVAFGANSSKATPLRSFRVR